MEEEDSTRPKNDERTMPADWLFRSNVQGQCKTCSVIVHTGVIHMFVAGLDIDGGIIALFRQLSRDTLHRVLLE